MRWTGRSTAVLSWRARSGADETALARLLRAMASIGLVEDLGDGSSR